jgi:hypothetical protein
MQNRQLHSLNPVPSSASISDNDVLVLADNLRVHPDVLIGNGNGIFGSGVQGSGKTGILVRILEQAAQFHVPMVVFDREGDILPAVEKFPRGVVGTYQNCPSAKDVIKNGLQVIYDLSSWETMDDRGNFIASMVNSLYKVVDGLPVSHRTPCLIALDEAALFLPQRRGEVFSEDVIRTMINAFHNVATTGRKRGLTPVLFTQKISEINKLVLSPGTYIMGRQTVHTDLKRYLDYIERDDVLSYMTDRQICQFISSLQPGRAIVKLANGEQHICQFYPRESVHLSHTPSTQAALNRYAGLSFKPATFGAYIAEDEETEEAPVMPVASDGPTQADQIRALLKKNPALTVPEIMAQTGFHQPNVFRVRKAFFAKQKSKKGKSTK